MQLEHGDLYIMSGPARWSWLHGVSVHPQVRSLLSGSGSDAQPHQDALLQRRAVVWRFKKVLWWNFWQLLAENLHRKSKEPSSVQTLSCCLRFMWQSSKFAINVLVSVKKLIKPHMYDHTSCVLSITSSLNITLGRTLRSWIQFSAEALPKIWRPTGSTLLGGG